MAITKDKDRIRFRYGICLNDNCEKCKSKEIQEIPSRKDFVCQNPECGKPLRECPPPKKGGNVKILGILAALVLVIAVVGGIMLFGGQDESSAKAETTVEEIPDAEESSNEVADEVPQDTILLEGASAVEEIDTLASEKTLEVAESATIPSVEQPVAKQHPSTPSVISTSSSATKDLGYAVFRGKMKNGQPDDVNGRMEFKQRYQIDSRDPKKRIAEAGDYVIGEYSEGHLVQGIWYGADNQVKGSIIIGK